jgi:hypothetical protein
MITYTIYFIFAVIISSLKCSTVEFFAALGITHELEFSPSSVGTGSAILNRLQGDVMRGPINTYLVFYGSRWTPDRMFKIQNFVKYLDQSSYFSVIKNYKDSKGPVTGPMRLNTTIWQSYEMGQSIQLVDIFKIMDLLFPSIDPAGIYVFLSDDETKVEATPNIRFCKEFCGFHTTDGNGRIISFVGDAGACRVCAPNTDSPNLDPALDATISILAHEIVESISNPDTRNPSHKTKDNLEVRLK